MVDFYKLVGIFAIVLIVFYLIAKLIKGVWTTWLGSALGFGYNFKHSDDAFAIVTGKCGAFRVSIRSSVSGRVHN